MKIQVKDLKPNPFRNLEKYPIDREKVDALKASIKETTFWDNLLVRKSNNHYETAYGHNRTMALKELGIKEIDVPIRELTDAMMLKIMANENMHDWELRPIVVIETVKATRDFLDSELAKYETWEALNESIKGLTDNEHFHQLKRNGVGQTTIMKFLGEPWKQWMIQEALANLESQKIYDGEVQDVFSDMRQLTDFRKGIEKINKEKKEDGLAELTKKDVLELAKKTKERKENIKDKRKSKPKSDKPKNTVKPKKEIETIIRQELGGDEAVFTSEINDLIIELNKITTEARKLSNNILGANTNIKQLNIQIASNAQFIIDSVTSFSDLFLSFTAMMDYFGINFKNEIKKLRNE